MAGAAIPAAHGATGRRALAAVPRAVEPAALLSITIGAALFAWILVNLAITLLGTTTCSVVLLTRWAVIGLLGSVAVGAFAVHTARLEDAVLVVAHRGVSKAAPENTMADLGSKR
jgi:hypothetical protein